jgi:hypothetical protein
MPLLIADCPRCGAKSITFDVSAQAVTKSQSGWLTFEVFGTCRHCHYPSIFIISTRSRNVNSDQLMAYGGSLNDFAKVEGYVSLRHEARYPSPEFLPDELAGAFAEGATCYSMQCYNAAATMFRLCLDIATRPLLPDTSDEVAKQPNEKVRRDLGLRLQWLLEKGFLDPTLKELARCVREDANDGAHVGNLSKEDAEDLLDFTTALVERLITEPKRLAAAEARRRARREPKDTV